MIVQPFRSQLDEAIAERDKAKSPREKSRANRRIRSIRLEHARSLGTHTDAQWFGLVAAFQARCVMCSEFIREGQLRKDHIVPIYQGGSDGIENIQPLCVTCNCAKGADSFNWVEYRMEHGFEG